MIAHLEAEKRQLADVGGVIPRQKAAKVVQIPALLDREGIQRIRIKYGPYKIRGANVRLL
jgi:hypothetical protein